jgi:hypothetical protein
MTAAGRVEKNTHELPGWWIGGLNWNALSFIIQIREGLETNSFHKQNNPKSGAFMKHGRNIILKTPILQLLGTPDEIPDNETIRVWMEKMAGILGVDPGMPVGEHGIVAISNLPASKSKNFNLESTGFTWGDYLSELVKGRDLVTQWAKNAFVTGSEDIGLGQLGDPSLGQDYAIEEHRQFSGEDSENYLPFARQWAETGNVP